MKKVRLQGFGTGVALHVLGIACKCTCDMMVVVHPRYQKKCISMLCLYKRFASITCMF